MTEDLKKYLTEHGWNEHKWDRAKFNNEFPWLDSWSKNTCSECYSTIQVNVDPEFFIYSEDCPDIYRDGMFPHDVILYSEEKLIEFLEKKKLTNWP